MGIQTGQSWAEYCEIQRMNPSTLVAGCKSMRALKRQLDFGFREETNAMRMGTGIHALLLEPETFEERFCVVPDFHLAAENVTAAGKPTDSKATTYYKTCVREFASANKGKAFLSRKQYDDCLTCIESIRSRPKMAKLLAESEKEVTVTGVIEGVEFKGRIDVLGKGTICDVKTTANISKHVFGRQFHNLHYGFKLSIYRELVRQATGKTYAVSLITQEPAGDFDNAYVPVPDIVLDNAWSKVLVTLGQYKQALASGEWPGVDGGKDKYELVIPQWAMEDEGDELDWGNSLDAKMPEPEESYW